jgi:type I restriction enzyme S subunit
MSSEWKHFQLGELSTFKYGKFLAKSQLNESGYPVFSGYGIVGYLPTYQFDDPQLLIVCRGEGGTGDVKMSPSKCSITNLSIVFSPNEQIVSQKFLYWALKAADTHRLRTGSAQAQIVIGSLEKLGIAIPTDKLQQDEIACILDTLNDRITLLRETNATMEAIAQALFKSWFVDFDPVRAKMEGRIPEGMDEATAALFSDEFQESELGLVPMGWKVLEVSDVAKLFSGGTPDTRKPEYWNGDLRWFSSGETRDLIIVDTEKRINPKAVTNSSTKLALPGDILIASAGQGHTRGQTSYCAIDTYINQSVVSVRVKVQQCGPLWLFNNLIRRYAEMRDLSDSHSSRGSLTTKLLGAMPIVLPPMEVVSKFEETAKALMNSQIGNTQNSQTLATLRDTLLPRLISGQLRVNNFSN